VPFHERAEGAAEIRAAHFRVAPAAPGTLLYSDLNYMLLGWAIEACAGEPVDRLAGRRLLGPLGMMGTRYRPPAEWLPRLAASEVWGLVHDESARAMDGVSGHAGLFSTLDDVARFAAALLAPHRHPVLPAWVQAEMTLPQAGAPPDVRGLGWRLQPWELLDGWPADAFGHTGFTGTSLAISPSRGLAAVLLTNATHPRRREEGAAAIRRAFHTALADCLFSCQTP
jgi:CubicO group peptidase (beta-lactamase class C family)